MNRIPLDVPRASARAYGPRVRGLLGVCAAWLLAVGPGCASGWTPCKDMCPVPPPKVEERCPKPACREAGGPPRAAHAPCPCPPR